MKYRQEIDGLRAFAVLPVILFHCGFSLFSGGYVGVDIFFVISGYLITGVILDDIEKERFSIVDFYERRIRRILPALFFVVLACLPFAWFLLFPTDLRDFGQSLVAVATFSSNVLFWLESGYFDTSVEYKPLLHTWSLAVEEQYYIFFPVLLAAMWKYGAKLIWSVLAVLFIASLLLAEWSSRNDIGTGFYLLHTRIWELLIGVFACLFLRSRGYLGSKNLNEVLSIMGFVMIVFSIIAFKPSTPFPSFYSLVPTIGTGLVILSARPGTVVYKLLSLKVFVGIGLISYSAYLWHQPLLAFARHAFYGELSLGILLFLCVLSLVLAYVSWRWIEGPFRNRRFLSRGKVFGISFVFTALLISIGFFIHYSNGLRELKLDYEMTEAERRNYMLVEQNLARNPNGTMVQSDCQMWAANVSDLKMDVIKDCYDLFGSPKIVLGDSHAMNIYNIFAKSNRFEFLLGVSQGGCRAHDKKPQCQYDEFITFLQSETWLSPTLIYHQGGSYFITDKMGRYEPSLTDGELKYDQRNVENVIDYLVGIEQYVSDIYWLGSFTEYRQELLFYMERFPDIPLQNFEVFRNIDAMVLGVLASHKSIVYIPFPEFYKIPSDPIQSDCLLWRDIDHFSRCGEKIIAGKADFHFFLTSQSDY